MGLSILFNFIVETKGKPGFGRGFLVSKLYATILAGAWMFDCLGEKEQSKAIFTATEKVITKGKYLTYDLGGNAKLSEMTDAIAKYVEAEMK